MLVFIILVCVCVCVYDDYKNMQPNIMIVLFYAFIWLV